MPPLHQATTRAEGIILPEVKLLDRLQMAQAANVSCRTLDTWRSQGIIPFFKVGKIIRFDLDSVMSALRERYEVRRQKGGKAL
jgi:phage terminase Nu1 subunit (DNA packaging protein)